MEILISLGEGFRSCLTLTNMLACVFGVIVGALTGILPGLGSTSIVVTN